MKKITIPTTLWVLGLIAFLAIIAAALVYFVNFNGNLLDEHDKWGMFGDFLGGTTSPILNFLTFIGVLWTIALNKIEIEEARSEARCQDKVRKQEEVYRVIQTIHDNINNSLDNVSIEMPDIGYVKPVVMKMVISSSHSVSDFNGLNGTEVYTRNCEVLKDLRNSIYALNKYCNLYETLDGSAETTFFFKSCFHPTVGFLAQTQQVPLGIYQYFSESIGTSINTVGSFTAHMEPEEAGERSMSK